MAIVIKRAGQSRKKKRSLSGGCAGLGKRIAALREKYDLGIDRLAKRAKLSKGNLSDIENGRRDPRCSTLCALAKAFGISLSELLIDL